MATNYRRLVKNLLDFFDFSGRTIVSVGAGGGQLIEYGRPAAKVTAVDRDAEALDVLRDRLALSGLSDKFELVRSDFLEYRGRADAVLFEFCLHEMPDPSAALSHARSLAPSVVVMDHWPGSAWAFVVAEEDKAVAAWAAVLAAGPERTASFEAEQSFDGYEDLWRKVHVQGETSIRRIAKYKGMTGITIPMSYGFALLPSPPRS